LSTASPPDELPEEHSLSKLLGISMDDLWNVLIACDLAKKRGKRENVLDKKGIRQFIVNNKLTKVILLDEKDKQPVLHIGIFTQNSTNSDHCPTQQWKSNKRPPRPLQDASKAFREDLLIFLSQNKKAT
jgi:hypothetical protein